jgi:L-fuconolactonase
MVIDSHNHFWHYNSVEYNWIDDSMKRIRTDFLPGTLEKEMKLSGVDGVISVQARQSLEETEWLLQLASEYNFIRGITGWVPLCSKDIFGILEKLASDSNLKGVRHVLQAESVEFMLSKDFNRGISVLKNFDLIYEILILHQQLPAAIGLVDMHPDQVFILDHISKPGIKKNIIYPWNVNIKELAKRENVFCKISGIITEADYIHWNKEQFIPYFDTVVDAFGPERLMYGSDWPVCLVGCEYARWKGIVGEYLSTFSGSEQEMIMGTNADFFKI